MTILGRNPVGPRTPRFGKYICLLACRVLTSTTAVWFAMGPSQNRIWAGAPWLPLQTPKRDRIGAGQPGETWMKPSGFSFG